MAAVSVYSALALADRAQPPGFRVAAIEFFGHKGLDTAAIRAALPFREGDEWPQEAGVQQRVRAVVLQSTGKEPTDVARVCCTADGGLLVFIGIPGESYQAFAYSPAPTGQARVSTQLEELYDRLGEANDAAVRKGGDAAKEDRSKGYALTKDQQVRSIQLELRRYAIRHEPELLRVLESSSDQKHRAIASQALGYARQSGRQLLALTRAVRDPGGEVRNNATRAIGVLLDANQRLAHQIPPDAFIEMLNSGIWTDRNKAGMVLERLTASRNPVVLAQLRSMTLDSLIEMTLWRATSHAYLARMLLGRVAGIPEKRLKELAAEGPPETIVEALRGKRGGV
jgi:hypothetical protein